MAHGKTLRMIQFSKVMRLLQNANKEVSQGNPDHYHAKAGRVYTHLRHSPEFGDRRQYRAIVRREREEAEQLRNRARLQRYGVDEISGP